MICCTTCGSNQVFVATQDDAARWSGRLGTPGLGNAVYVDVLSRFVRVVRATSELKVLNCRATAVRKREHMVKFEKPAFSTAAGCPDERALAAIARPYLAFYPGGHVATRHLHRRIGGLWLLSGGELAPLDVAKQRSERTIEEYFFGGRD